MRLLVACLLLLSAIARAECPRDTGQPLPAREELIALERTLASHEAECGADAGYLAYRGAVLNALGRHAEAALVLERALLLDPELAGAQLDYAEALAGVGDISAAMSLMRDLLALPDVPPALRTHLARRLNALDALQRFDLMTGVRSLIGPEWRGVASLTIKAGHDTNLNSAPSRSVLPLTLPGGEAILLLSEQFRARGGAAGLADLRGQVARRFEGGSALQIYGEGRVRASPGASDTDYQQAQVVFAWSQPAGSGEVVAGLGATHLHYGGENLYNAVRVALSRDWQLQPCQPRLGLEAESRHYPSAGELEGRFVGAVGGFTCRIGASRVTAALRGGVDVAQRERPGGDQRQADFRLVWISPLGSGSMLADLVLARQWDETGYSPLLEENAERRVRRASLHLEYDYPVARNWSVVASFDGTLQRSNLALFDVSGRAFYLGMRWQTAR